MYGILDMKNTRNIFNFLKDEYAVFFKVLFVIYILSMIYVARGLPVQIFTTKAKEVPQALIAEAIKENTNTTTETVTEVTNIVDVVQQDGIYIPKLGIYAPLSIVESTNPDDFIKPLNEGVTHFPSVLPGEKGDAIILGHSAPPGWIDTKYDSVFSEINTLLKGDIILVTYNNEVLRYEVQGSKIVEAGQETPSLSTGTSNLQLISCWPPGIDHQRIVVYSELI